MHSSHRPPGGHRSHRRRKRGAGRLGLAGALTGIVGIAAVAAGIMYLRADPGPSGGTDRPSQTAQRDTGARIPTGDAPQTGPPLSITTPEGYGYNLAAVMAGTSTRPLGATQAPPPGTTYAYADYVLTNSQRRPVLLDFPADLFMPRAQVPSSAQERCMPQAGVPDEWCTLPNHSSITARVGGARAPVDEDGTTMIPAGASYVVRIASELPVKDNLSSDDLRLYVWNARFTSDRKGIGLAFP
ncbi:hypothetical protein AGRA3207_006480 [Actinomadura graeca]|uniref:Serine/threonine protein kinase n=1 Tax=Actinomadura graeca TaxID=2750812 RepID=A0ABX8R7S7_9ACTN|nr:hypothetical protein [Actinomadura graeca]QXJ25043.1 hypothetical protein AGRA3207_006480 [Actinomadura graeca]